VVELRSEAFVLFALLSAQVGLDAAGKTTILYKLKLGEIVTTIPTIGEQRRAVLLCCFMLVGCLPCKQRP